MWGAQSPPTTKSKVALVQEHSCHLPLYDYAEDYYQQFSVMLMFVGLFNFLANPILFNKLNATLG